MLNFCRFLSLDRGPWPLHTPLHCFSFVPVPSLSPYYWRKPLTISYASFFSKTNMAGAQFEYDEKGTTFYYFLISFFGIVLVPLTYYVWKITKLPGKFKISPFVHKTAINSGPHKNQLSTTTIFAFKIRIFFVKFFYYFSDDKKRAVKICRCPPCVEKRENLRKKEPKSKSIRYLR